MIYLDNASTTKPSEAVKNEIIKTFDNFGNPSSMHRLGMNAENVVKNARNVTASILGVSPDCIYFTSGGTESNNTAILGYVRANKKRGNHIITTKVEHPSVLSAFELLEKEGFDVTYLSVDNYGVINLEEFEDVLTEKTIFVSVMCVNNETGAIMPIDRLKPLMKNKAPLAALHVDAVQSFGKIPIKPKSWGIDLLSASGHKIHALKGTGMLYVRENLNIQPLLHGGGQQKSLRSGTENVLGIAAFSKACEEMKNYDRGYVSELRNYLKEKILKNIPDVKINEADAENQAEHILNVSFLKIKSEILLHSLEVYDIYVSTGSACSTHKPMPSHVLTAMGCSKEEISGAVRFSFSSELTKEDIDKVVDSLKKEVETIRKYVR